MKTTICFGDLGIYLEKDMWPVGHMTLEIGDNGETMLYVTINQDFYDGYLQHVKDSFWIKGGISIEFIELEKYVYRMFYVTKTGEKKEIGGANPQGAATGLIWINLSKWQKILREEGRRLVNFEI